MIHRPTTLNDSYYFTTYVKKAQGEDLLPALRSIGQETLKLFKQIEEDQANYRYASGKWTLKQVFRHITDTERIFCYRALRISRNDKMPLPGYDQDDFANLDNCEHLSLAALQNEYVHVRNASIAFYKTISTEGLDYEGIASDLPISARTIGWILVGHNAHHLAVIKDLYLNMEG